MTGTILPEPGFAWGWQAGICPACKKAIIYIQQVVPAGAPVPGATGRGASEPRRLVQPRFPARSELGSGVADELKLDYLEACAVLGISPKASAALSRRILQSVLQQQGYTKHRLVDQVEDVLNETDSSKALPTDLRNNVDVIRKFGNFSAHETVDRATAEIIGVEPEEAEWVWNWSRCCSTTTTSDLQPMKLDWQNSTTGCNKRAKPLLNRSQTCRPRILEGPDRTARDEILAIRSELEQLTHDHQ